MLNFLRLRTRKVEDLKMDVMKNGNGDVYYVQFEKVKALYLVHMKVIVE